MGGEAVEGRRALGGPRSLDFCLKPNRAAVLKGTGASGRSNTGQQAGSGLDEAGCM